MAKNSSNSTLIALLVIIIGVVVISFMLTKNTAPVDNVEVEVPYSGAPAQNFNFAMPDVWDYTENALKDIQTLTPNQTMSFGVVASANDSGAFYFATTAPDPKDATKTLHSIYQYNNDLSFERIYRVTYDDTKAAPGLAKGVVTALHPIGHDGYKLIILAQDADSSPGPCTEVLTLGRDTDDEVYEMLSLNLLDPFGEGLRPYQVPDEIYDAALQRQNNCSMDF
jgi:hypothetical protein